MSMSRLSVGALLLLAMLSALCCLGTPPPAAEVASARDMFEAFAPLLRLQLAGEPVVLEEVRRAELAKLLEQWPAVAASMTADGDGFRDAERSTCEVLSPRIREALEGKPLPANLRRLVALKLESWQLRIESQERPERSQERDGS